MKVALPRPLMFNNTPHRPATIQHIRIGANRDGKITAIGRFKDVNTEGATTVVDANGTTVAPGLIDSHVHPVAGDWTPRQNQIGWIDSYLHGGVTTMISAGEVHMPGRPRDVVGL